MESIYNKIQGYTLIAHKLYNPAIESDDFLSIVLLRRDSAEYVVTTYGYVVWTYNSISGGFSDGAYFTELAPATKNFNSRGRF